MITQLDRALAYAVMGWAVFPVHAPAPNGSCDCGKQDCSRPAKHPWTPNGFKDATKNPEKIRELWGRHPGANIGIATGVVSGLGILYVDGQEGAATVKQNRVPMTPVAKTAKGRHYYFKYPGYPVKSKVGVFKELDSRADGGYVVAPGSQHISGTHYEWEEGLSPDDVTLADAPEWWLAALREAPHEKKDTGSQAKDDGPIPEGKRNATLTSMAGSMRRSGLGQESIEAALLAENTKRCSPPLPESEVRGIAASVCRYSPSEKTGIENLTDAGNARRLVSQHGSDLRYCHAWGKWLIWDEKRWKKDESGAIVERAKKTVRAIYAEAAAEPDEERRKALSKWARESERRSRLTDMIVLAQSEQGIPVTPRELDSDPWLLNCRNGTVDLRTGNRCNHKREDKITKIAPVDYDPAAKLNLWDSFLRAVTDSDNDMMDFLQRAAGYSLTGDTGEEKLFMPHGAAATGKSTFLEAFKSTMGEYAATADFEAFLKRRDAGGPRNDIARLAGARLVVSIEVDEGKRLAEGLVKMLTGGDTATARFLHKEAFEFAPQFKLWLAANHEPKVSDEDSGMWRRILRIPFEHAIPEDERDPAVKKKLKNPKVAGAAILAWAVKGALAWQRDGLQVPDKVKSATNEYRQAMDPLKEWFDAHCAPQSDSWTASEALRKSYQQWATENDVKAVGGRGFGQRLKERGLVDCKQDGVRGWRGVKLS